MRCAVCVAVIVQCNSPDDPCVFVVFLSGQVEGTVTSAGKLEVTDSRVPVPCDTPDDSGVFDAFLSEPDDKRADSHVPPTAGRQGSDCSRGNTFQEVHLVFPQITHASGSNPAANPCPTTDVRPDSVHSVVPQHTLSPSGAFVTFLSGQVEITASSPSSQWPDASSSTTAFPA